MPSNSEDEARAVLEANARQLLGNVFVAALIHASHQDPALLSRVAAVTGMELWVTVERAHYLHGQTRFSVTVYPGERPRQELTPPSAP